MPDFVLRAGVWFAEINGVLWFGGVIYVWRKITAKIGLFAPFFRTTDFGNHLPDSLSFPFAILRYHSVYVRGGGRDILSVFRNGCFH